jgi:hypothetical protein
MSTYPLGDSFFNISQEVFFVKKEGKFGPQNIPFPKNAVFLND